MELHAGRGSVSSACRHGLAGCDGRDGRDAVYNWHLWIGCVFSKQAAAGIGNSYGPRRAAQGSITSSVRTPIQIAGLWFRGSISPPNSRKPGHVGPLLAANTTLYSCYCLV